MMRYTFGFAFGLLIVAHAAVALQVKQVYRFPSAAQIIENIAIRPNGHLLLNTFDNARIYTIDPAADDPQPQVAVQVPAITGLTGIAEIAPDVFAVSGGVVNAADYSFVDGTARIVTVNFNQVGAPALTTVAQVPSARLLNGLASLPKNPHIVLSADSKDGRIFRINTLTGSVDVAFQDNRFTPGPFPKIVPLGINGIKIQNGHLYLTNSEWLFFARVPIDDFGNRIGELEILAHLTASPLRLPDDFSLASNGTAYLAAYPNTLVKIPFHGIPSDLVGGSGGVTLDAPTATALTKDEKTVFVVTSGGGNGQGGQIVAVEL